MTSLRKIKVMTHDVTQAFSGMHKKITSIQPYLISWQKGHPDSYILNVDGSAQTNPGIVEFGGLIRGFDGQFIRGFHGNISYSNILHAEILALLHGIQICWDEGMRHDKCQEVVILMKIYGTFCNLFCKLSRKKPRVN